jgi:hypothetical protein
MIPQPLLSVPKFNKQTENKVRILLAQNPDDRGNIPLFLKVINKVVGYSHTQGRRSKSSSDRP